MRVLIIGAAGMLGQKLAARLLERGSLRGADGLKDMSRLVLFDKVAPSLADPRLELVTGDVTDSSTVRALLEPAPDLVFHLAAVVSGEAERHFEVGMAVNLQATLGLLEACRALEAAPRFLFSSSVAVFGGELPPVIQDDTAPTPQSSYGTQKALGELLVNDYSRRGFVDGRALRLPTLVVRPGTPNQATSSFASSIIREPLQGKEATCPVAAATELWLMSPRCAVDNLIHAAELPAGVFGKTRTVNLPGVTTSVQGLVSALAELAGRTVAERITWQPDPFIQRIVGSWPARFNPVRAKRLGFKADDSVAQIIRTFTEDDMPTAES